MPSMAFLASSGVPMVTKPKPRGRPVSRSLTRWTSETAPNSSKAARRESVDVLKFRLPTYRRVLISISLSSGLRHMTRAEGPTSLAVRSQGCNHCLSHRRSRVRKAQRPETRERIDRSSRGDRLLPRRFCGRKQDRRRSLSTAEPPGASVGPCDLVRLGPNRRPTGRSAGPGAAPSGTCRRSAPGPARAGSSPRSDRTSRRATGTATSPAPGAAPPARLSPW